MAAVPVGADACHLQVADLALDDDIGRPQTFDPLTVLVSLSVDLRKRR
jgi:hypothetical protein